MARCNLKLYRGPAEKAAAVRPATTPDTVTVNLGEVLPLLADAVARADTVEEVFAAALDALERGIGVDRAAVVLFDADGGIEFRAWRGLSDAYRERVRGRRPWQRRIAVRSPFVVEDVLADEEVAELHETFRVERIRSMALVPQSAVTTSVALIALAARTPASVRS